MTISRGRVNRRWCSRHGWTEICGFGYSWCGICRDTGKQRAALGAVDCGWARLPLDRGCIPGWDATFGPGRFDRTEGPQPVWWVWCTEPGQLPQPGHMGGWAGQFRSLTIHFLDPLHPRTRFTPALRSSGTLAMDVKPSSGSPPRDDDAKKDKEKARRGYRAW